MLGFSPAASNVLRYVFCPRTSTLYWTAVKGSQGIVHAVSFVVLLLKIRCFEALGSVQVWGPPADMSNKILNIPLVRHSWSFSFKGASPLRFLHPSLTNFLRFYLSQIWRREITPLHLCCRCIDKITTLVSGNLLLNRTFSLAIQVWVGSKLMGYGKVTWSWTDFCSIHRLVRSWYVASSICLKPHITSFI